MSDEYYLVEGVCVDCKDPENHEICFHLVSSKNFLDTDFVINLEMVFNKNFASNVTPPLLSSDILVSYQSSNDSLIFEPEEFVLAGVSRITLRIKVRNSFAVSKSISIIVPSQSRLRADNRMRLNEFDNQTLTLTSIAFERILVPQISGSDKSTAQSFQSLEESINQDNNMLMNTLKYCFVIRYLSNNQIIVYSGLLKSEISINLHISTQALSSGMKPLSEKFNQNSQEYLESYSVVFMQKI